METMKTFDAYAIFQRGMKQYQAVVGKTIEIDQIDGNPGDTIEFDQVLFKKSAEESYEIGKPFLQGSVVKVKILKHLKGIKTVALRFKRRKKVRVQNNGRSRLTIIRVESI